MNIIQDKMFNFIYTLSLRDALLRNAYKYPKKPLFNNIHARDILKNYVNDVLNGANYNFYEIEKEIENSFRNFLGNNTFTFGNSQKLVNMTFKYAYLFCYKNNQLTKCFSHCHCPMDNIMINVVIDEIKNLQNKTLTEKQKRILNSLTSKGYKTFLRKPWSQITQNNIDQYTLFQNIVKFLADMQNITPLQYDYLMWDKQEDYFE